MTRQKSEKWHPNLITRVTTKHKFKNYNSLISVCRVVVVGSYQNVQNIIPIITKSLIIQNFLCILKLSIYITMKLSNQHVDPCGQISSLRKLYNQPMCNPNTQADPSKVVRHNQLGLYGKSGKRSEWKIWKRWVMSKIPL